MDTPVPSTGLRYALLGLLIDHPMHPYEMHQYLLQAEALGLVWHLKQGLLYALLAKLEATGYLTSTMELQGSRPPRKVLHITAAGQAAFAAWVAAPVEHGRDFRVEFLAKLFFADQQGSASVAALITRQRSACQGWIKDIAAELYALDQHRPYDRLVLQFRLGQLQAVLPWLDQCEEVLAAPVRE